MKSTRFYSVLAVTAVAVLLLGACGPQSPAAGAPTAQPTGAPTAVPVPTAKPQPKIATFIWTQEPDSLNPLYTNMWFSSVTQQIWSCWAWDFDDKNNPQPILVTEIPSLENGGISADGKTITLTLRPDVAWSDGTALTSEDFLFTHQMHIDPHNAVASSYPDSELEDLTAPDAQTVVMKFAQPFAPWLAGFWHGIIPAHILKPVFEKDGTLDNAEWNRSPTVSCGPYIFEKWESGSYIQFVANEKYWRGRPKIDEIFFKFVPDDASQIAALKSGEGDLGTFIAYPDIAAVEATGAKILWAFSGYNEGIYFYLDDDNGHPALKDVRVRQAIALATDRESLCQDLLLGLTKPASTDWDKMTLPGLPDQTWNDPSIAPWPYDPNRAKALLDEAGWKDTNGDGVRDKDGVELVLDYGTTQREVRKDTQAVFQQQLADVGIKVNLLNFDSTTFFSSYAEGGPAATGQLDMFQYSTVCYFPDPDTSEWRCDQIPTDEAPDGSNWQAVCDQDLDTLLRQQATQIDLKERQATWNKLSKHIFENVYWLGLWQDPDNWAIGPRLKNVRVSGATPFFSILEWDLEVK